MFMTPKNTFSIKYIEIVQRHGSGYKVFKRTICFIIKSSYSNVEDKQIFYIKYENGTLEKYILYFSL